VAKDLVTDENNDFPIDPETGDFILADDSDQSEAYRVALGTNEGELPWNPDFGLNHLSILSQLDDESAVEDEISDYLEQNFDNFQSAEITDVALSGREATISLTITSVDDNGDEQETETEMGVETDGIE